VTNKPYGRTASEQAWVQLAAYGITLCIALFSGALCGFIASLLPHPKTIFDDEEHWFDCFYGDVTDVYNVDTETDQNEKAEEFTPAKDTL